MPGAKRPSQRGGAECAARSDDVQLAYHEPNVSQLLTLLSFLLLLNVARILLDKLIGAGLIGELAIGIIYQQAGILPIAWREFLLVLGYLGLILIVFEGGLATDSSFIHALPLGVAAALLGVLVPMAFTFAIFRAFGFSTLYAFTAGSALASTSLGTTFFVLQAQSKELRKTRVARVLTAAALFDDIVALVLLSVVTSIGGDSATSLGWVIGRPILASVLTAALTVLLTEFVLRPAYFRWIESHVRKYGHSATLILGASVLSGWIAITSYAGTTNLLGAFLAGYILSRFESGSAPASIEHESSRASFRRTFEELVSPLQNFVFAPVFFASIGFSIPFPALFTGTRIWRGVVYSVLMALGKVLAGVVVLIYDGAGVLQRKRGSSRSVRTTNELELARSRTPSSAPDAKRFKARINWACCAFLGIALVPRGEIGVLILQVAYASPGNVLSEDAYLVALWAVILCTIVGPIMLNLLVKRRATKIISSPYWGTS